MEYLLKASAVIAIFYVLYFLFLRNETFFKTNRFFLLSGLFLAVILPIIAIPIYVEYTPVTIEYTPVDVSGFTTEHSALPELLPAKQRDSGLALMDYILLFYLVGVAAFLVRFIIQLVSLAKIIAKHKSERNGKYIHVITDEITPPFSFFNWIVYNPKQFSPLELEQIITHEKVHVNQRHSIDILVAQLASILLWFNPFIHLYAKSLKQNLEFLADNNALTILKSKKAYQYTLLKTCATNHQLALSNNFYNSFIKKRIVMLQKSKSKKINRIKYLLVLPFLGWFLMSFNTEAIYVEKENIEQDVLPQIASNENEIFHILDAFTDKDLAEMKNIFFTKGYRLNYENLKRNKDGLITSISIQIENDTISTKFNSSSILPIKTIKITLDKTNNTVQIENLPFTDKRVVMGFPSKQKASTYRSSKKLKNILSEVHLNNTLLILDNKEVSKESVCNLNSDDIDSINFLHKKNATEKYGKKGVNGALEILTKQSFIIEMDNGAPVNGVVVDDKNGISSFNGHAILKLKEHDNYIVFVDGNETSIKIASKLAPSNIMNIKVLNGNSAIKKYEKKGKDGVIEITTNKKNEIENNSPWKLAIGRQRSNIQYSKSLKNTKVTGYAINSSISYSPNEKNTKNAFSRLNDLELNNQNEFTISGVVKDVNGTPLPGTNIIVKDTKKGAISDFDGKYKIKVKENDELIFSYIGFNVKVIKVHADQPILNVMLNEQEASTSKQEESQIVSRASIKTIDLYDGKNPIYLVNGAAISKEEFNELDAEQINSVTIIKGDEAQSIFGDKAKDGVIIIQKKENSNLDEDIVIIDEGENNSNIKIRAKGKTKPLIIIDGKERKRSLKDMNTDDIEKINVLKGESAINKYGEKGKNGVIEITTKKKK